MQQAKQKCSNLLQIEWEVPVAMETEINERFSIVTDHNVKKTQKPNCTFDTSDQHFTIPSSAKFLR